MVPWLASKDEPAAIALGLPERLRLDEIPAAARGLGAQLRRLGAGDTPPRRALGEISKPRRGDCARRS